MDEVGLQRNEILNKPFIFGQLIASADIGGL